MDHSSFCNSYYDVFPSFSGEDVRKSFLSHFLKELDRKLIKAFKDNKIKRGQSIDPELKQAIRSSRLAVVLFSKNYPSSSWCLNELLEIVKCKERFGQLVMPVFYGLDPSHVRKQSGVFGEAFEKTCMNRTEDEKQVWRKALTDVANIHGYHSKNWHNEAQMIEEIINDLLTKLNLTPPKDFQDFVGIEDHITKMSLLLCLESEEVRMVGIWGPSGIGKTTIARALFNRLSRHFKCCIFIDRAFVCKSMEIYGRANPGDYNLKLHLQGHFLSEVLGKKDVKIDHLGAVEGRLKHQRVLIFIDDLDDQVVLDALVGQTQWFGCGSRVILVTQDKHILRAHGIDHIYEVCLPSKDLALEILCQSAFKQKAPPDGFGEFTSEVVECAGSLPLGLNVLGLYLRGRDKEDWMDMLPRLRNKLDGKIEKALRVGYDGLSSEDDKAIFRYIACLFNGFEISDMKLLLTDSNLDINIGLKNLVEKSLIHVKLNVVVMHRLLQEIGKQIVQLQSKEPGEREFLVHWKDIRDILDDNTGTKNVLGISLDVTKIDELHIHERAFNGMRNLRFLEIYKDPLKLTEEVKLHLPEGFDYLPPKLGLLRWDEYPLRCMPSKFRPENLVKLRMWNSKLQKLWEGVGPLTCLKDMDMWGSEKLKEIPNLSMATNLETLDLKFCSSLVELPSSIRNLNKLKKLDMMGCINLETLPSGINLKSIHCLNLIGCSRLRNFPDISRNISFLFLNQTAIEKLPSNLNLENLVDLRMEGMKSTKLWEGLEPLTRLMTMLPLSLATNFRTLYLSDIPSLVEFPSSLGNLNKLTVLSITRCKNLETLPSGINLEYLNILDLRGCSRLKSFPCISRNVLSINLCQTAIEEVPSWIENFSKLKSLTMKECKKLKCVSLNFSKLKHLGDVDFSDCEALTEVSWHYSSSEVAMEPDHTNSKLPIPKVKLKIHQLL